MRAGRLLRGCCLFLLVSVFLLAASYKAVHFREFLAVLRRVAFLSSVPEFVRAGLAGLIVSIESVIAVLLVFGNPRSRRTAAIAAAAFLVTVSWVVLSNHHSISITCDCMWRLNGIIPDSGVALFVRNAVLLALALVIALTPAPPRSGVPSQK